MQSARVTASTIIPWIGSRPIAEVTAPELLAVVRRIENRGVLETAHRALGNCGQVFRYAVATGRAVRDPSGDLRGALPPVKGQHFAAATEPKRFAELLRAMDGYEGTLTVRCALRVAPLVFVRPGELRKAEWADIDLDTAEWRYTVTKTQTIVPLSRHDLDTAEWRYTATKTQTPHIFPLPASHGNPARVVSPHRTGEICLSKCPEHCATHER
jgi:integrase